MHQKARWVPKLTTVGAGHSQQDSTLGVGNSYYDSSLAGQGNLTKILESALALAGLGHLHVLEISHPCRGLLEDSDRIKLSIFRTFRRNCFQFDPFSIPPPITQKLYKRI